MGTSRGWNAAVVAVLTAGGLALGAASPAAVAHAGGRQFRTAGAAPAGPAARLPVPGGLDGVAARSPGSAWAVGQTSSDSTANDKPILAHWNGTVWRTVSSPALPSRGALNAVATFPGGGWAVGQAGVLVHGGVPRNLIVRLAGTAVRRVRLPGPADGELFGVAATSAANAWAVGGLDRPLILHWNGTAWKRAPLPSPDRALERQAMGPGRQPGYRHALRTCERGRHLSQERLGRRLHRFGASGDPALGRPAVEARPEPEPGRRPQCGHRVIGG